MSKEFRFPLIPPTHSNNPHQSDTLPPIPISVGYRPLQHHLQHLPSPKVSPRTPEGPTMSSQQSKSEDKGQQPTEFSTLMLLLRAACVFNAGSNAEVCLISTQATESFGVPEIDDPLLAPLEALAAILVQHSEVIAASYTVEAGAVIAANSCILTARDSVVMNPDPLTPKDSIVANPDPSTPKDSIVTKPDTTLTSEQESDIPDSAVPQRLKVNANNLGHLSCKYIITTNSYRGTQDAKASNPHNLRVMNGGKDLWREFKDGYHWLYALYPVSLMDHGTTLCAYLTDYRNEADITKRSRLSARFSTYLISVCWPKMHDRIMSWPFMSLIHNIRVLRGDSREMLEEMRDKYDWQNHVPGPGDRSLAGYLSVPKLDPVLEEISQVARGPVGKLIAAVRTVPANSSQGLQFSVGFYTKETFMDFHNLLLGCLMLYAQTLRVLRNQLLRKKSKAPKKITSDPDINTFEGKIILLFDRLENYNRLLLLIMSSHSFSVHLNIMVDTQTLAPTAASKKFHSLYVRKLMSDSNVIVDGEETVGGELAVDNNETEDNQPVLDSFEALLNWMQTAVFHFIAKRVLENHCRQLEAMKYPITITFIAMDHPVLRFPSWLTIRDVIKKSLSPGDPYEDIVKAFEKEVRKMDRNDKLLVSLRKSLDTQCDDEFPGTLHCEAVLAALALYPESAIHDDKTQSFTNIAKGLRSGGVRVSKLCCPACSRLFHCLLQIYEEQHENDKRRPKILTQALASHTVPYPVQLPQWLPGDVVERMVTYFRPLLAEALQSLLSPPGDAPVIPPGKVHRSQQSLSSISVGSSNAEVTSTSEVPDRFRHPQQIMPFVSSFDS